MPIDRLIEAGKPLEAWEAIQKLPRRLLFSNEMLQRQLECALALGWERKAMLLREVLAKSLDESLRGMGVVRNLSGATPVPSAMPFR